MAAKAARTGSDTAVGVWYRPVSSLLEADDDVWEELLPWLVPWGATESAALSRLLPVCKALHNRFRLVVHTGKVDALKAWALARHPEPRADIGVYAPSLHDRITDPTVEQLRESELDWFAPQSEGGQGASFDVFELWHWHEWRNGAMDRRDAGPPPYAAGFSSLHTRTGPRSGIEAAREFERVATVRTVAQQAALAGLRHDGWCFRDEPLFWTVTKMHVRKVDAAPWLDAEHARHIVSEYESKAPWEMRSVPPGTSDRARASVALGVHRYRCTREEFSFACSVLPDPARTLFGPLPPNLPGPSEYYAAHYSAAVELAEALPPGVAQMLRAHPENAHFLELGEKAGEDPIEVYSGKVDYVERTDEATGIVLRTRPPALTVHTGDARNLGGTFALVITPPGMVVSDAALEALRAALAPETSPLFEAGPEGKSGRMYRALHKEHGVVAAFAEDAPHWLASCLVLRGNHTVKESEVVTRERVRFRQPLVRPAIMTERNYARTHTVFWAVDDVVYRVAIPRALSGAGTWRDRRLVYAPTARPVVATLGVGKSGGGVTLALCAARLVAPEAARRDDRARRRRR